MGKYGTATGFTVIKTENGKVAFVGFNDGEVEAFMSTLGKIAGGGGRVRMERAGFVVEYDTETERVVYGGGSPRIVFGGSPRITYGGTMLPVFKFKRTGSNESYVFYQHTDELVIAFSANDGVDAYPTRWRFSNSGGLKLPVVTSAPTDATIGMLAYADGTSWNPGSGAGLYVRDQAGWSKL